MTRREVLVAGVAGITAAAVPNFMIPNPKPKVRVIRTATDKFDLVMSKGAKLRILQLTDTHFGAPTPDERVKDLKSQALIREMIATHQPDFLFHTGDFINNDKTRPEFGAIPFMNSLELPWSVVFGNHDHPDGRPGQKSLDEYYGSLGSASVGYAERLGVQGRDYCFRIDLRVEKVKPFASIFAFNTGNGDVGMKVNEFQTQWFLKQIADDKSKGVQTPIYVMQHIPTVEFRDLFNQNLATGRRGENVCFEQDNGEIFTHYVNSKRVRAMFCGHDHVNDYIGVMKNISLVYGRCSGYSGYGDWERGSRIIDIDTSTGSGHTKVVLGKSAHEKPEWSQTMKESSLG